MAKNTKGQALTEENRVVNQWKPYFEELQNRPEPEDPVAEENQPDCYAEEETQKPTIDEIRNAISSLKNSKSIGIDGIPFEL